MKPHFLAFMLTGAVLTAAEPDWINEGFEVPKVYKDGQPVAGVEKTAEGAGGWEMDPEGKDQTPDAFIAIAPSPPKVVDPKAEREIEMAAREALKESEKDLDRDARKKAEEARENAKKAAKLAAEFPTRPGQLSLVPGQKTPQSMVRKLSEPLKAPFFMAIVMDVDYTGGRVTISLEDEIVDLPFELTIHKQEEQYWKLSAGGSACGLVCRNINGRHIFITGMVPDPKNRGKLLVKAVSNPLDLRDPFKGGVGTGTCSPTVEFKDFVRLRINKSANYSGKIDEIRFGKTLRDVLP